MTGVQTCALPILRGMLDIILRRDGHQVILAANGQEAIKQMAANPGIELVLSDLRMEPLDGIGLLAHMRQFHPDIFVIIMTAFAEWDTAVRAMRQGAYNFLRKPFDNQVVRALIARALDAREHYLATRAQGTQAHPPGGTLGWPESWHPTNSGRH